MSNAAQHDVDESVVEAQLADTTVTAHDQATASTKADAVLMESAAAESSTAAAVLVESAAAESSTAAAVTDTAAATRHRQPDGATTQCSRTTSSFQSKNSLWI